MAIFTTNSQSASFCARERCCAAGAVSGASEQFCFTHARARVNSSGS